ncbi:sterol desaturase family protein [Aquiflexum sp. XJ19-10]|uniref:Sterol desaturase family protein n=1 Tax=Aquiflexum gelatinilyticum TaxID=2961943 RepID=A0A9X2SZ18_9BACT|nr:sterol desaturase family protein [Aquiflexum gelatinilyticum]MCR9016142.1 sterol desaturase family protein [Aquiflexum gelatinilyticum]MCS4436788.1 sterol desaturase family protein [Aquiflexum gelatinilyticum]
MMYAVLFILIGFAIMEFSGWFIHKYIMHGPLWNIHKTHHEPSKSFFELNDLFSLLFGSIAILLIFIGVDGLDYRFWIGVGISLYGVLYFIIHDVLVHRRVKWFERPKNSFLLGIFRAHQAHHATNKKNDAVSFGLFIVPKKYFKR